MRRLLSRLPALSALLIFCIIIGLYIDGWFDISFIARGSDNGDTDITSHESTDDITTENTPPASDVPPITDETSAPPVTETNTEPSDTESTLRHIISADSICGDYSMSTDDWTPGGKWLLAEAKLDTVVLPN